MSDSSETEVKLRHAPKFGAFMVVGGAIGAGGTLIATSLFPSDPAVGFVALFGYFALFGISAGVVVGAVIALVLDRRSSKRARVVTAERASG